MSFEDQDAVAAALKLKAALHQLETGIQGINATRYLSAAGLVILLYDHILLFGEEKRIVWTARASWSKTLFLVNRYIVPLSLIVTTHQLSGLSTFGLSTSFCKTWFSIASFICVLTLATANIFVVHRIYALWGRNRRILKWLASTFTMIYLSAVIVTGFSVADMYPNVSYQPLVRTCIIEKRPNLYVVAYALPIVYDIFLCGLTCWNAFDRPRSMQTAIVKQLYLDGVVYFAALLSLRIFNIVILAFANIAYVQLGVYFLWSMITALINRMLITISQAIEEQDPRAYDPSGRETPFELMDRRPSSEYELTGRHSMGRSDDLGDFVDFSYDAKEMPLRLPVIERGMPFNMLSMQA